MRVCACFSIGGRSPCTGLAIFEEDIVSVGEDGCLCLLTAKQKMPVRRIGEFTALGLVFYIIILLLTCFIILFTEGADSCSLRCVCFLKHNEVLTGNLRGQMKVWDLKNAVDKPASTFMLSGEQVCVTVHVGEHTVVLFSRCN
jgi:nuclear pore complex protein Nup43